MIDDSNFNFLFLIVALQSQEVSAKSRTNSNKSSKTDFHQCYMYILIFARITYILWNVSVAWTL